MAYNKIVYGDTVLIDLTGDTATEEKVLAGEIFHDASGAKKTGTCAYKDVSGVTAGAADVLAGKKIVSAAGEEVTGTMPNRGAQDGVISTKDGIVVIQKGYHDGNGTVALSEAERAKIISENIKLGVTLLGVEGGYAGEGLPPLTNDATADDILAGTAAYGDDGTAIPGAMPNNGAAAQVLDGTTQEYKIPLGYHNGNGKVNIVPEVKSITPSVAAQSIAPSAGKVITAINVAAIPYTETANDSGGYTVQIG